MLKPPATGGPAQLRAMLDTIPPALAADILGTTDRTRRRWFSGEVSIPRAVWVTAWVFSAWGDSAIRSHYGYSDALAHLMSTPLVLGGSGEVGRVQWRHPLPPANDRTIGQVPRCAPFLRVVDVPAGPRPAPPPRD